MSFKPNKNEAIANYALVPNNVLLMIRYPKYINLIKKKFGDGAEILFEELLQRGYCNASELLIVTQTRFQKEKKKTISLPSLRDDLFALITAKYVSRLPYSTSEELPVPILEITPSEEYTLPSIDIKLVTEHQSDPTVELPDKEIYWTINFDRLHQDIRDKIIVNAFTRKFDENVGEFVRLLLEQMYIRTEPWAGHSNPVPLLEVKSMAKKMNTHQLLVAFFDQYANVLGKNITIELLSSRQSGEWVDFGIIICIFINKT